MGRPSAAASSLATAKGPFRGAAHSPPPGLEPSSSAHQCDDVYLSDVPVAWDRAALLEYLGQAGVDTSGIATVKLLPRKTQGSSTQSAILKFGDRKAAEGALWSLNEARRTRSGRTMISARWANPPKKTPTEPVAAESVRDARGVRPSGNSAVALELDLRVRNPRTWRAGYVSSLEGCAPGSFYVWFDDGEVALRHISRFEAEDGRQLKAREALVRVSPGSHVRHTKTGRTGTVSQVSASGDSVIRVRLDGGEQLSCPIGSFTTVDGRALDPEPEKWDSFASFVSAMQRSQGGAEEEAPQDDKQGPKEDSAATSEWGWGRQRGWSWNGSWSSAQSPAKGYEKPSCRSCGGSGRTVWDKDCPTCGGSCAKTAEPAGKRGGVAAARSPGKAGAGGKQAKPEAHGGAPVTPNKLAAESSQVGRKATKARRSTGGRLEGAAASTPLAARAGMALSPEVFGRAGPGADLQGSPASHAAPGAAFDPPSVFDIATPQVLSPAFTPQTSSARRKGAALASSPEGASQLDSSVTASPEGASQESSPEQCVAPPDLGNSWEWPLSRREKVTRLQGVERLMHSLDVKAMRQELTGLRQEKRRLSLH